MGHLTPKRRACPGIAAYLCQAGIPAREFDVTTARGMRNSVDGQLDCGLVKEKDCGAGIVSAFTAHSARYRTPGPPMAYLPLGNRAPANLLRQVENTATRSEARDPL